MCSSGQIYLNVLIYPALVRVLPAASAVYHKVLLLIKMMHSYDFTSTMGSGSFSAVIAVIGLRLYVYVPVVCSARNLRNFLGQFRARLSTLYLDKEEVSKGETLP